MQLSTRCNCGWSSPRRPGFALRGTEESGSGRVPRRLSDTSSSGRRRPPILQCNHAYQVQTCDAETGFCPRGLDARPRAAAARGRSRGPGVAEIAGRTASGGSVAGGGGSRLKAGSGRLSGMRGGAFPSPVLCNVCVLLSERRRRKGGRRSLV